MSANAFSLSSIVIASSATNATPPAAATAAGSDCASATPRASTIRIPSPTHQIVGTK